MFTKIRDLMSKWKWLDQKLEANERLDVFFTGLVTLTLCLLAFILVVVLPMMIVGSGWFWFLFWTVIFSMFSWLVGDSIVRKRRHRRNRRY